MWSTCFDRSRLLSAFGAAFSVAARSSLPVSCSFGASSFVRDVSNAFASFRKTRSASSNSCFGSRCAPSSGSVATYRDFGSSLHLDAGQNAVAGGFDFHHRFVGFDLQQGLAFGDGLAFFLQP